MAYKRVSWVDEQTPLCAENLNHMEDGIEDAAKMADDLEKRTTALEETAPDVDERVKTLEETVPDIDKRLTTAESEIDSEQEKTTLLLGTPWQPIVCTYLNDSTFDSTYDDVLEDPLFQYGGINAVFHVMKRNVALGKAADDEDQRYFVFDASTKELLLLNAAECLQAKVGERTPIASFAVLQSYDPESEQAMSGKAMAEALANNTGGGGNISVVSTYDPEGEDAVNGQAVAKAIAPLESGKLDATALLHIGDLSIEGEWEQKSLTKEISCFTDSVVFVVRDADGNDEADFVVSMRLESPNGNVIKHGSEWEENFRGSIDEEVVVNFAETDEIDEVIDDGGPYTLTVSLTNMDCSYTCVDVYVRTDAQTVYFEQAKAYTDASVGDIESALDSIITIQENLIGGDA